MLHAAYEVDRSDEGLSTNDVLVTTTGCGCCSSILFLSSDKEKIENQLEEMAKQFINACNLLGKDPVRYIAFVDE